ncbi:hypothetical protein BGZ76_007620 [Entomortierella beljakovae]|nr:hypothetical protein BGZ76_007620 [Entomortierella beljakovae]
MAATNLYPTLPVTDLEVQGYKPVLTKAVKQSRKENIHVTIANTPVSSASTSIYTNDSEETPLTLSQIPPIPLKTYVSMSHIAISSALKVAMVSTSMTMGIARTIVSTLDKALGGVVKGVSRQQDDALLSPAFVASLPFRAALLGINFSDIFVQSILELVDGSVNLALSTIQDGVELMDTLFGPDSTSQTGETFREVWTILSRELKQSNNGQSYPLLDGLRLFMAYVAIQFATSEKWEAIRVKAHCRMVGECLESKDEAQGSSTAWSALAAWPKEWTNGQNSLTAEELLQEQRMWELREQHEGRSASSFSAYSPRALGSRLGMTSASSSTTPNPELSNFLAASYRFSRFCSAMYGSTLLEMLGAPERFPPPPPQTSANSGPSTSANQESPRVDADEHHFHCYTGTPLGSIIYSSDNAATIQDGYYSPRYYLLDDVETKQIVLVLRGTKSLHDLMVDLTCDTADLWLEHDTTPLVDAQGNVVRDTAQRKKRPFRVHGGFLKAARTIASADTVGIQEKVKAALEDRPGYSLLLIGHSLGAGIASILSNLWADPATGLTPEAPSHISTGSSVSPTDIGASVDGEERGRLYLPGFLPSSTSESFLPPGRRLRCYGYGSPKVMCPRLSKRCLKLVTSISYGDDAVGRLSLGSVRNIVHSMRAILAIRPSTPLSPPESPKTDESPEVLHNSEILDELLESEGEGINHQSEKQKKPAQKNVALDIVQKVIRWRLTGEEQLLDEFMEIRRSMHRESNKYQERYDLGDFYADGEEPIDFTKISTVLVPPGKVLWIRPTTWEKELENAETHQHPINSVIHQFEWDHEIKHDPATLLQIPKTFHDHLEEEENDSESIRSLKSTVRSSLYSTAASSPSLSSSPSFAAPSNNHSRSHSQTQPYQLQRRDSVESIRTFQTGVSAATTSSPASLHPESQNTDKLLYRMYAVPEPDKVFDEMLFSRRMWSDHLPLTYEYILAGKHAIPVSNHQLPKARAAKVAAAEHAERVNLAL